MHWIELRQEDCDPAILMQTVHVLLRIDRLPRAPVTVRFEFTVQPKIYWLSRADFADAVRHGDIRLDGPPNLVRPFPTWLRVSRFARCAPNVQRLTGKPLRRPEPELRTSSPWTRDRERVRDCVGLVYVASHTFHYGNDARGIMSAAGARLGAAYSADTLDHTRSHGLRYITNPPGNAVRVHQHRRIGDGDVDWAEFFGALAQIGFLDREDALIVSNPAAPSAWGHLARGWARARHPASRSARRSSAVIGRLGGASANRAGAR